MAKKKLKRSTQRLQTKQNDNLRTIRPLVQQTNSEISFIISAETTPKKMAIPSRKTKQETKAVFHKVSRALLCKITTKITRMSQVRSST